MPYAYEGCGAAERPHLSYICTYRMYGGRRAPFTKNIILVGLSQLKGYITIDIKQEIKK